MNEQEYIKSLENLLIFMCKTYDENQKTLFRLNRETGNDAAFKVPMVQGLSNTVGLGRMAALLPEKNLAHGFTEIEAIIRTKREESHDV